MTRLAPITGLCLVLATVACTTTAQPALAHQPPTPTEIGTAPAKADGTIRIATYNVLNLFDDHDDPSLTGRFDDFYDRRAGQRAKPAPERAQVAAVIRAADADVIGLQEIESFDALVEFVEQHLADMGYDYITTIDVGQERGIQQAILSRFPIKEATVWPYMPLGGVHPEKYGNQRNWYAGQPILYRRSPLRVVVEVPAATTGDEPYDFTLFVVHHKSGRYNDYWRERESTRLLAMINDLQRAEPNRNIAVLGDFNAQPDDESIRTYTDGGLSDVFAATGDRPLTHESARIIDLILVNDAFAHELVTSSPFVLSSPLRPWGSDYRTTPKPDGYAADHLLVAIDINPHD